MKYLTFSKKILLILTVTLFAYFPVQATHYMGGEITWTCIKSGPTQGMYIFRLKLYRDCNGSSITAAQTITVHNHPSVFSISVNLVSQLDISPLCMLEFLFPLVKLPRQIKTELVVKISQYSKQKNVISS